MDSEVGYRCDQLVATTKLFVSLRCSRAWVQWHAQMFARPFCQVDTDADSSQSYRNGQGPATIGDKKVGTKSLKFI